MSTSFMLLFMSTFFFWGKYKTNHNRAQYQAIQTRVSIKFPGITNATTKLQSNCVFTASS